jgi:hypothetical protein
MVRPVPIIEVLAAFLGNMVKVVVATPTNERQQSVNRASTERQQSVNRASTECQQSVNRASTESQRFLDVNWDAICSLLSISSVLAASLLKTHNDMITVTV